MTQEAQLLRIEGSVGYGITQDQVLDQLQVIFIISHLLLLFTETELLVDGLGGFQTPEGLEHRLLDLLLCKGL